VEEGVEIVVSNVVVPGEAVSHLVFFAGEPLREKDGGVVEEELGGGAGHPEAEGSGVWRAVVEARVV
jgi:hypothetical protein